MSSTIAIVSISGFSPPGTRRPAIARAPRASAMSVAIGTPQPCAASPPATARYNSAGTTIPPTAATAGRIAERGARSSPVVSSRLISIPTSRKKIVISPSFTQNRRSVPSTCDPSVSCAGVPQNSS